MKVLLYLEAEHYLRKSGIGRAIKHQERALTLAGIDYTTNPEDDYDLVHINTYGLKSWRLMKRAKKAGKKILGILLLVLIGLLHFLKNTFAAFIKKLMLLLHQHLIQNGSLQDMGLPTLSMLSQMVLI